MTTDNPILLYLDAIEAGQIVAGKWIRMWYRKIADGLASGEYFYDKRKARKAIRFVERMCHHSKGRRDYIKLELWQQAFYAVCFGIVDAAGRRQFREVVLVVARKTARLS